MSLIYVYHKSEMHNNRQTNYSYAFIVLSDNTNRGGKYLNK